MVHEYALLGSQFRLRFDFSEDVELRRIFPSEFPLDTVRRTGSEDPEV